MKNTSILLRALGFVLVLIGTRSQAQDHHIDPSRITYQVEGLTSATRDEIVRELKRTGDMHLVFACVPAGIIVVEARSGATPTELEARSAAMLRSRSSATRIRRTEQTLAQAEAACEQVRNR